MFTQVARISALLAALETAHGSLTTRFAPPAIIHHHPSELRPEYDYVIIGGGTSGLTVANRLTEDLRGRPAAVQLMFAFMLICPSIVNVLVIEYGYLCVTLPGEPLMSIRADIEAATTRRAALQCPVFQSPTSMCGLRRVSLR